jgi:hypothetical protein
MKTWTIFSMDTAPQEGDLQDVVKRVYWMRQGTLTNEAGNTFYADYHGSTDCPSPSETDFTAYADLTEATVKGWLDQLVDVEMVDDVIDQKIHNAQFPPVVQLPLPWQPEPVLPTAPEPAPEGE